MKSRFIFLKPLTATLLTIVFSLAISAQPDDRYIKGVVQSPSGRPLTSVWVIVSQNGNEKGRSLTGDDGKYYISNLDDGAYDLLVYRGDKLMSKEQVHLRADSRRHDVLIK
jgi:hypothetical protein